MFSLKNIVAAVFLRQKPDTEARIEASPDDRLRVALEALCRFPDLCLLPDNRTDLPDRIVEPVAIGKVQQVITTLNSLHMSQWKQEDTTAWSQQPRTYIILHNLDCVHLMNKFIEDGLTDIWLPYNNTTLPDYVQPQEMRALFLQTQQYLLTDARDLEHLSSDVSSTKVLRHINLPDGGSHFRKLRTLGKGSYGVVEEVYSYLSRRTYARKSVLRRRTTGKAQRFLAAELNNLKQLSHRHLVKVLGSYTDTNYIAYLMEPVADSNLDDFLTKPDGLTDGDKHDVRSFFGCLAGAVNYLHRSKIRHRDLSSRNILVHRGSVIISDFGSAYRWAGTNIQGSMTQHHDVPVTSYYMAPEIARKAARNSSSDMWSLGVIFLEMTTLLAGRTLKQLRSKLSDNHRLNIEPYFWANPRLVTVWLQILQQSNQGPAHDNEPLEWIRDLLDPIPKNRPTSGVLMQDIHDTQSFHIFCCIDCQSEFRERRFRDNDMQIIDEEASENAEDIMQDVANILVEVPQPVVISPQTHSTIQSWLADTDALNAEVIDIVEPNILVPSRMPGEFDTNDNFEGTDSDIESSVGHMPQLSVVEPDNLHSSPNMMSSRAIDQHTSLLYPYTSQLHDLSLSTNLNHVKDTGLGFGEIDSPSSSDDGILVHSDSSDSDADSDDTIVQIHVDGEMTGAYNESRRCSNLTLPNFAGDDNLVIQTLASMEDDPDEDIVPKVITEVEQVKAASSKVTPALAVILANDRRIETTETFVPKVKVLSQFGGPNITHVLNETPSAPAHDSTYADSRISDDVEADPVLRYVSPDQVKQNDPELRTIEALATNDDIGITTGSVTPFMVLHSDEVSELPSDHTTIRQEKNLKEKRSVPAPKDRRDSLTISGAFEGPECPPEVPRVQNSGAPQPFGVDSTKMSSQQDEPIDLAEMPLDEQVALNKPWPQEEGKCSFQPNEAVDVVTDEQTPVVKPRSRKKGELASRQKIELSPAETPEDGHTPCTEPTPRERKKKAPLHVSFAEDPSSPTLLMKEDQTPKLEISPNDYIRHTWDSASIATSVMSDKTKRMLNGLTLNRWWDRDHNLMEYFCSQGKAQAVRALLEKGCNPGKAGPKTQRRSGPITFAVQGASQKHNTCVKALIEAGVDVNVVNNRSGKTPLHLAIENPKFKGYEHLVCALIDGGANPNHADIRGDYPIMKVFHGTDNGPLEDHRKKALALLLRNESTDIEVTQPGTLNTSLHIAVRRKDPFAVAMLLFKKARINAKNAADSTPLLVAANQLHNPTTKDQRHLMSILLNAKGILINERAGVKEQTALHYAVNAGVSWAVDILLKHGADPTCRDSGGRDALALAHIHANNDDWSPEDRDSILSQLFQASVKEKKGADVVLPKRPKKNSASRNRPASPGT